MKGMSGTFIEDMTSEDREWYLARLYSQLKEEERQMKAASRGK